MLRSRRGAPPHLPIERARARLSAFVYGNLLVLGALIGARPESVGDGQAIVLVAATTVTTYVAHVAADLVGEALGRAVEDRREHTRVELRDALPIISSGGPPALLLGAGALGWLDWLGSSGVLLLAIGFVVARLASTGWVAGRFSTGSSRRRVFWTGIGLAGLGLAVAVVKVAFTH